MYVIIARSTQLPWFVYYVLLCTNVGCVVSKKKKRKKIQHTLYPFYIQLLLRIQKEEAYFRGMTPLRWRSPCWRCWRSWFPPCSWRTHRSDRFRVCGPRRASTAPARTGPPDAGTPCRTTPAHTPTGLYPVTTARKGKWASLILNFSWNLSDIMDFLQRNWNVKARLDQQFF